MIKSTIEFLANVAMIVVAGVAIWLFMQPTLPRPGRQPIPPPTEVVSLDGASTMGNTDAPVIMIVYSDFECPWCSKFATEILPTLQEKYIKTGKVRLAFRNFPLENIHKQSLKAAIATICASEQGKFWAAHDWLFQDGGKMLKTDWVQPFITAHGLTSTEFMTCMNSPVVEARVKTEVETAKRYNISGTPTVFLGTRAEGGVKVSQVISGTLQQYIIAIDSLLN